MRAGKYFLRFQKNIFHKIIFKKIIFAREKNIFKKIFYFRKNHFEQKSLIVFLAGKRSEVGVFAKTENSGNSCDFGNYFLRAKKIFLENIFLKN